MGWSKTGWLSSSDSEVTFSWSVGSGFSPSGGTEESTGHAFLWECSETSVCLSMRELLFCKVLLHSLEDKPQGFCRPTWVTQLSKSCLLCWEKIAALLSQLYKTQCSRWPPCLTPSEQRQSPDSGSRQSHVSEGPCTTAVLIRGSCQIYIYIYICVYSCVCMHTHYIYIYTHTCEIHLKELGSMFM